MGTFSSDNDSISVSKAAEILGVSTDTVRRWEKAGKIAAQRSPGGHRIFSREMLEAHKKQQQADQQEPNKTRAPNAVLSISAAAELLGISADTLRRWEKAGKISAQRSPGGHRQFSVADLKRLKMEKQLTTAEVAALLEVSESSVRRLENEGHIPAKRDERGNRRYAKEIIETYKKYRDTAALKPTKKRKTVTKQPGSKPRQQKGTIRRKFKPRKIVVVAAATTPPYISSSSARRIITATHIPVEQDPESRPAYTSEIIRVHRHYPHSTKPAPEAKNAVAAASRTTSPRALRKPTAPRLKIAPAFHALAALVIVALTSLSLVRLNAKPPSPPTVVVQQVPAPEERVGTNPFPIITGEGTSRTETKEDIEGVSKTGEATTTPADEVPNDTSSSLVAGISSPVTGTLGYSYAQETGRERTIMIDDKPLSFDLYQPAKYIYVDLREDGTYFKVQNHGHDTLTVDFDNNIITHTGSTLDLRGNLKDSAGFVGEGGQVFAVRNNEHLPKWTNASDLTAGNLNCKECLDDQQIRDVFVRSGGDRVNGGLNIIGTRDETQLSVHANQDQTANLFEVKGANDTSHLTIINTGNISIGGTTNPTTLAHIGSGGTPGTAGAGDVYIQNDLEVDGTLYADGGIAAAGPITLSNLDPASSGTIAFSIDHKGTTADAVNLSAAALTSGIALDIPDLDALTAGTGINVVSNSSNTAERYLININQDHASASGAVGLRINQDSTADIFQLYDGGSLAFSVSDGGEVTIAAPATANTTALCWDNSGNSTITDCDGSATDLAENFGTNDASIEAGDIVAADTARAGEIYNQPDDNGKAVITSRAWVKKATPKNHQYILGIVSTQPNQVFGDDGVFTPEENPRPVSLAGRVPVKVSLENGPIQAGDRITISSEAGIGMRAGNITKTVGIALEPYNRTTIGKILAFVDLKGAANADTILAASNGEQFALLSAVQNHEDQIFAVATLIGNNPAALSVEDEEGKTIQETVLSRLDTLEQAYRTKAATSETSNELELRVAALETGLQPRKVPEEESTAVSDLQVADYALPTNTLTDTIFSKPLVFSGDITIEQGISVIGELEVHSDAALYANLVVDTVHVARSLNVHGDTALFGNLTVQGNTTINNTQVQGELSISEQQAGFATIPRGGRTVEVVYAKTFNKTPLVQLTPVRLDSGIDFVSDAIAHESSDLEETAESGFLPSYYISSVSPQGFAITLSSVAERDITLSWITLSVMAPKVIQGQALDTNNNGIFDIDEVENVPTKLLPEAVEQESATLDAAFQAATILEVDPSPEPTTGLAPEAVSTIIEGNEN